MLDRTRVAGASLAALKPWAVVDCAGPFVGEDYQFARTVIEAGAHYLDLSDGRAFAERFGALDALARAHGVAAICGASSTPALSSAVCDALTRDLVTVRSIEVSISPGNRAPRGLAVVRSILGYAGKSVPLWREGRWGSAPGWGLLTRKDMGDPVGWRWLSLCDAPDLGLFPARYKVSDRVIFRGGLELSVMHLGLSAASQLPRFGILPSLLPFSEMARDLADALIGLGTDAGGMLVEIEGTDAGGKTVQRYWRLIAEAGVGPNVPVLAAFALLKRMLAGQKPEPGARPCLGEVPLTEFTPLFRMLNIRTETNATAAAPVSAA
ncbi:MAG TPA: saccharopine dehydrogenase [Alphaproteobacteria bacterium]|nr:saccharopine dehydrogenase [Alphaproteobacteria bacterium]